MSPKRILIFSLAYHPMVGGAEIAVKEITSRIFDIEFDVITLRFNKAHAPVEKMGNCTIYRINTSKNLYPLKAFMFAKKLHRAKTYEVIWAIMANWAGFAALFFKYFHPSIRYILTLQEGDPIEYIENKIRFVYPLWKRIFTRADKIQAISTFLAHWAENLGYKGGVEVIPNGVDTKKFQNIPHQVLDEKESVLITTSRLGEKNAVGDIVEALKFLSDDVKLEILGTGPLEKSLKLKADSLQLGDRVKFFGHVSHDDLPKYLHGADIFIRPSLSEGMGNSFIEAMAAGLPVIATPVGGIPDFLTNEETGLFCEVKNPKSIARQVKRLMEDNALRNKIVENARHMVKEKYDWDLIAGEMKTRVFDKV